MKRKRPDIGTTDQFHKLGEASETDDWPAGARITSSGLEGRAQHDLKASGERVLQRAIELLEAQGYKVEVEPIPSDDGKELVKIHMEKPGDSPGDTEEK